MPNKSFIKTAIAALLCTISTHTQALDDQWYLGIGGGISGLTPEPENEAIERTEDTGAVGTFILGRDFDDRSSGQFQLFSLGESEFDNGDTAAFAGIEAAVLYRFYDTRDNQRGASVLGASVYGRFGLGYMNRDSDQELNTESSVYFGAGGGVETYLTNNFGVRAELQFYDTDAVAGTLSVVGRFGGFRRDQARRPPPVVSQQTRFPTQEEVAQDKQQAQDALASNSTPQSPQLPETAVVPEGTNVPETFRRPLTTGAPAVSEIPETAVVPEGANLPEIYRRPLTTGAPAVSEVPETADSDSDALPSVEIMVDPDQPDTRLQEAASSAQAADAGTSAAAAADTDDGIQIDLNIDEVTAPASADAVTITNADVDADDVPNSLDQCPQSTPGFPVDDVGCSLLRGDIVGLDFESDSKTLLEGTTAGLDEIAALLTEFPEARIDVRAYTDNIGSEIEQAQRTRGRLRSIGLYLVDKGVRARQLVLRSFGAKNPAYNNDTLAGRRGNNRVEINENPG